jgi:hypothetical protein
MTPTSSPAAFVDPLAQALTPPAQPASQNDSEPSTSDRAALVAPDVLGRSGAEAIELVRAKGLIAAIETVELADDTHQGLVIEQDPKAGSHMVREGVVTLRVAQAAAELQSTEGEDATGSGPISSDSENDNDDTAEWFAALEPSRDDPSLDLEAAPQRRKRKHRLAAIPVEQIAQPSTPGPFTAAVAALLVRLPRFSVSSTWRRRALIVVGAFVGVVVLTRGGASHPHLAASPALTHVPASLSRTGTISMLSPSSPRRARHRRAVQRRPTATRRRPTARPRRARASRVPTATAPREAVPATAGAPSSPTPQIPIAPANASPRPPAGQFAYLGQ